MAGLFFAMVVVSAGNSSKGQTDVEAMSASDDVSGSITIIRSSALRHW